LNVIGIYLAKGFSEHRPALTRSDLRGIHVLA
jgi:hypothetical protein